MGELIMCLTAEWFERANERNAERDRLGVSARDAEAALQKYHSTVYPIAVEMAEWIVRNWSASEIARLDESTRDLLCQIIRQRNLR